MTHTKPSLHSALVALALLAGIAQASPAHANGLLELSRQMIGSSFEQDRSTALPSSPSTVDAGSARVDRVVGDLVDQEIRQRPLPPPVAAAGQFAPRTVQLIVPVQTGLEFGRIQQLVPTAKILEMGGSVFVLVAETRRAMSAYALGRQLQERLGFTFQLAYSEGHPDLNMAWMAGLDSNRDHAARPKPAAAPTTAQAVAPAPKPRPAQPVRRGTARDVGLLAQSAPWRVTAETPPAAPLKPLASPTASVQPASALQAIAAESQPTERPAVAVNPQPEPAAEQPSLPTPARPDGRSSLPLAATLAELRAMRRRHVDVADQSSAPELAVASAALDTTAGPVVSAVAAADAVAAPTPGDLQPGVILVQPVAIRTNVLADVPVVSDRTMAANPDLAYLYVKVHSDEDLVAVKRVAPVSLIHDRDGELLARVGVFTNTRIGERLRNSRLAKLRSSGYEVELVAGRLGSNFADQS